MSGETMRPRAATARGAAVLALLGALTATAGPAAADAAPDTDPGTGTDAAAIAATLQESPVHIAPAYAAVLPEPRADALRTAIEESGEPLYVIVVPLVEGDAWQGDPATLAAAVHDRMDADEGHYLLYGGTMVEGADYPEGQAEEPGAVSAHYGAMTASYEQEFEGEPGVELESAVETALSGDARQAYTGARDAYMRDNPAPLTSNPAAVAWAAAGAVALLAAAVGVGLTVRARRRRREDRHALRALPVRTTYDNTDAARLDELSERIETALIDVGERLAAARPDPRGGAAATAALADALNAHAAAGKAHAMIGDGVADLADAAGALVLLDHAEQGLARASAPGNRKRVREPLRHCYCNPLHGATTTMVDWRAVGSRRSATVPLCAACAKAVKRRSTPKALIIRHNGQEVPYYTVPGEESVWAATGFGTLRGDLVDRIMRGDLRGAPMR